MSTQEVPADDVPDITQYRPYDRSIYDITNGIIDSGLSSVDATKQFNELLMIVKIERHRWYVSRYTDNDPERGDELMAKAKTIIAMADRPYDEITDEISGFVTHADKSGLALTRIRLLGMLGKRQRERPSTTDDDLDNLDDDYCYYDDELDASVYDMIGT